MMWKPNADEKRAIRAVAATSEGKKPMGVQIEVGERISTREEDAHLPMPERISINILTFGPDDGLDKSDLQQPLPWTTLDSGVELVDGKAIVDFYVYERLIGDHGDLLTNVQAHVDTLEGKPRLVKITGTGMPDVTGETLWAFTTSTKSQKDIGTRAYWHIQDWKKSLGGAA